MDGTHDPMGTGLFSPACSSHQMNCFRVIAITSMILFLSSVACLGLEPQEVLVLANRNAKGSVTLARYYMEQRKIPGSNLLQLSVTDEEHCSRDDYEKKIVPPLKRMLGQEEFKRKIRCLVILYGLPLKIDPPPLSPEEKRQKAAVENHWDRGASLDSEIALVLVDHYPLAKWVPNPFFLGHQGKWVETMPGKGEALMVSRLDGPDQGTVRRMIDDAIITEEEGLSGVAYFDARWPRPREQQKVPEGMGYEFYDRSIHVAAEAVRKTGRMAVVVNDHKELFRPGECPGAALYCGWYSLGKYVDAFSWARGAVGYHIASSECTTLKQKGSQVWCKRMLEEGVAAAAGPVNEPYVQAFPIPELFFSLLLEGYWTLAECYALSQPFWSWQMVLLGDPLYRPFMRFRSRQNEQDRLKRPE